MKSMLNYVSLDEMMVDSGNAQFFDDVAEGLHDRAIYDYIKKNVMDLHPSALTGLLTYMINLVLSDKEIDQKEIEFIYGFGKNIGFSEKEISLKFAEIIQRKYVPSLAAIC